MALDPILAAFLDDLRARGVPRPHEVPPERAREMYHLRSAAMRERGAPPEVAEVTDRTIPGPGGQLPVRVYRPRLGEALPTVLFAHGGGYVLCDVDSHDPVARRLAVLTDAVVVSIDYRRAPEHPFPAAVEDTLAAMRWVRGHLDELGGCPTWGTAGDSAGANLTCVGAHLMRDDVSDEPPITAQLHLYPAVNAVGRYPSREQFGSGFGLDAETIDYFVAAYAAGADLADPRISPLLFPSHAGMPPTIVVTAGCDPLHDEGVAYVEALRAAGVPTEWHDEASLIHAFVDLVPLVPAVARAVERGNRRFGQLLRGLPAD